MTVEVINGSRTSFGPRSVEVKTPYSVHTAGVCKQLVMNVNFDNLPTHVDNDVTGAALPAGATITRVTVLPASTTFAGGTSYAINLVKEDGTAITTVEAAVTLAQMNSGLELNLAALDDATVGADLAFVEMVATGTFTAGETRVIVEYIEDLA